VQTVLVVQLSFFLELFFRQEQSEERVQGFHNVEYIGLDLTLTGRVKEQHEEAECLHVVRGLNAVLAPDLVVDVDLPSSGCFRRSPLEPSLESALLWQVDESACNGEVDSDRVKTGIEEVLVCGVEVGQELANDRREVKVEDVQLQVRESEAQYVSLQAGHALVVHVCTRGG
jgi:hypothetical protein